MNWALFALTFIFGYITCKAFYFLNSARTSYQIIKVSQLIGLGILSKSIENWHAAQAIQVHAMRLKNETTHNIHAYCLRFNEDLDHYKDKAIKEMIHAHSDFFKVTLEFEDWDSAMQYLESHREVMIKFLATKGR